MQKYKLKNLDCPNCANEILEGILELPCVDDARLSFTTSTLWITTSDFPAVERRISEIDEAVKVALEEEEPFSPNRIYLIIFFIALLISTFFIPTSWDQTGKVIKYLILGVIYIASSYSIYKKAIYSLKKGDIFNENFLMVFATLAAFYIGQDTEGVAVMLFYSMGEYFQGLAVSRSKKEISSLLANTPNKANLILAADELLAAQGLKTPEAAMEVDAAFDASMEGTLAHHSHEQGHSHEHGHEHHGHSHEEAERKVDSTQSCSQGIESKMDSTQSCSQSVERETHCSAGSCDDALVKTSQGTKREIELTKGIESKMDSKASCIHSSEAIRAHLDALGATHESIREVHPNTLKEGDIILVKPGESVPIDGVIVKGDTFMNTKMITGESTPKRGRVDDSVMAGFLVLDAPIYLRVLREYSKSSVYKILELIEEATLNKAKMEDFIAKFARYYTPVVFFLAAFLAIVPPLLGMGSFDEYLYRALVVLVVSCPCALVLSIPLSYFGGIGVASMEGILIKGANYLEALGKVSKIAFDKTGTLTLGVFEVSEVVPSRGVTEEELLYNVIKAEDMSNHPIAKSIKEYAHDHDIEYEPCCSDIAYNEITGLGVAATCEHTKLIVGNDKILHKFNIPHDTCNIKGTVVHVANNERYLGYIIISDRLKEDSKEAIAMLKDLGIEHFAILSGDEKTSVATIAQKLGIEEIYTSLLPEDKITAFKEFNAKSPGLSAFVGDGTNDAPVLSSADIGVGLMLGSDISKQSSDVILTTNSIKSLAIAIKIAKKTSNIIVQNIAIVVIVKATFIILGIEGSANLWEAVFGDVGVALLAILNTMRLLRVKK